MRCRSVGSRGPVVAALLLGVAASACADDPPPEPGPEAPETATAREPTAPPPTPLEAARAAYARACDQGDPSACLAGGKPDDACVHGDGRGCMAIADRGGSDAERYLARACRRGVDRACDRLPKRPQSPRVTGSGLGEYRHAVVDCWAETDGVDPARTLRGTIALTTDLDGRTTAIARFEHDGFRRCVERSASRWTIDGSRDVDLTIRPDVGYGHDPDTRRIIGLLGSSGGVQGGAIDDALGGSGAIATLRGGTGAGLGGTDLGGLSRGGTLRPTDPIAPRITVSAIARPLDDHLERPELQRRVRVRYVAGIKRCVRRALENDDDKTLATSIRLRFTVTPTGAIDNLQASSAGPDELRRCVKTLAGHWRFSRPEDDRGNPTTSQVMVSLYVSGR